MSNIIDKEENETSSVLSNRTDDLADFVKPAIKPAFNVKPTLPNPGGAKPEGQVLVEAVEQQQAAFRENAAKSSATEGVATLGNLKVKKPAKLDFNTLTEDDIYDMDIPMEARPFSSEDSLKVVLSDSGYAARWVNKDPRRLGALIAKGFSYVTPKDLAAKLEVEVSADAEGHYSLGDVILMKIPKERYFPALRAAHLRAIASVGTKGAHRRALAVASEFMTKETGGAFQQEASEEKVAFYTPGVTV